jgi:2-polyprenyl-3-methyl-5-hydroxy-6-metoxy-1,4-benzoquinol methylase
MIEKKYFLMSETVRDLMFVNSEPKKEYFYFIDICLLCNSKKIKYLFKQWDISYYRCRECEFVFSNPRLTDKGAFVWYNSNYYNAAMQTEHYIAENFDPFFSISLSPILLKKIIEFVINRNFSKNIKVVDVGCGSGAILHFLKDELGFCNLTGFDLNSSNIEFAKRFRKIDLKNVDIYKLQKPAKYDLIITTENIEHVSNPGDYVSQLIKLSKNGSYLLLSTPHNDEQAVSLMGIFGDSFCAPNHQNYFNFDNLSKLLSENKFIIKDYWLYDAARFKLFAFIKKFLIKRDEVIGLPPQSASLNNIYRWQKQNSESVILNYLDTQYEGINNFKQIKNNNSISFKRIIKRFLNNLIPIKFNTHQIILARYEGE